jgi:hypothetical protein
MRIFFTVEKSFFLSLSSGCSCTYRPSSVRIAVIRLISDNHVENPKRAAVSTILARAVPGATATLKNVGPSAGNVSSPVLYRVEWFGTGSK